MLDEAQDTNEVIRDLVLSQKCGKVIVGDRHQGIYSFIGASDALNRVRATKTMRLTACFRFHGEIARVANALLALNTDETQRLVGMNTPYNYKSSRVEIGPSRSNAGGEDEFPFWSAQKRKDSKRKHVEPYAVIARSNITLLKVAAELDSMKQPYIFVGGVRGYDFDLIRDMALFCSKSEVSKQQNALALPVE